MRVAILGPGRLGASLATLLRAAGVDVVTWSRGAEVPVGVDVYWVTVRDGAVQEVAALLPPDAIALHAAGAHGPELLGERPERGVLHPLMTFPGVDVGIPDLRGVGARVDGTPGALRAALTLAECLGLRAFHIHGDTRLYHAAASLASGHLSALFLDASAVLARAGLAPEEARALLLPLAIESLRRVAEAGGVALTGPAARGDRATERHHESALSHEEALLYAALSKRIRNHRA
ncbi:MAG: DUF2520 domain-containing protein [Pseudomonadota bacterium]|nr:DUF2520 domain-containing protein [Pseudomonadota bacterium]